MNPKELNYFINEIIQQQAWHYQYFNFMILFMHLTYHHLLVFESLQLPISNQEYLKSVILISLFIFNLYNFITFYLILFILYFNLIFHRLVNMHFLMIIFFISNNHHHMKQQHKNHQNIMIKYLRD